MYSPKYQPKLDMTDWKNVNDTEYDQILTIISPELHTFVEEHAALGGLMDQVRQGYNEQIYQHALREIETELEQHFLYEENFILPRLSRYFAIDQVGPVMKLLQEHAAIQKNFMEVLQLFTEHDPSNPDNPLIQKMNLLAYLLKKHIEKEDHYFFPMVSLILTQEEKAAIEKDVACAYEERKQETAK